MNDKSLDKSNFKKHKILQVAYKFPPIKSVGANRNYYFYQEVKKRFKAVFVLTTSNRKFLFRQEFPVDENDVSVVSTMDYRTLTHFFKRSKKTTNVYQYSKGSILGKLVEKFRNSFPFNLMIGEGGLFYIVAGFRKANRLVKNENIGFVYSSFRPYSDHAIGFLVKKFNPGICWIADFRDLHVDPIKQNLFNRKFQKWCNRKILAKADLVTTVSEGLAKSLRVLHPEILVLRNGIPAALLQRKPQPDFEKFTIAYTGSIVENYQRAEYLFQAIQILVKENKIPAEELEILYAGNTVPLFVRWIENAGLEKYFRTVGFVSFEEALKIQQCAHVNLLFSWASPELTGTLCGKLNEYLAAQKPLLCLIHGTKDDEFEFIFQDLNAGMVAYNREEEVEQIKSFLLKQYKEWKAKGRLSHQYKTANLKNYTWAFNMEKLEKYFAE